MADKKTIALSVAGILASLVLAYLLWRLQQRDAVAVASSDSSNQSDANYAAEVQAENESSFLANYQSQASSVSGSGGSIAYSTGDTEQEGTDESDIIDQVIAAYSGANGATNIPATTSQYLTQGLGVVSDDSTEVNNIPTSLSQIIAPTSVSSVNQNGSGSTTSGSVGGGNNTVVATPSNPTVGGGGNTTSINSPIADPILGGSVHNGLITDVPES